MTKNINIIYVRIFGKSLQFWHMVYIWMIYPTLYVIFYNILFNNNMIKISNIYVSINGSILQQINISWSRGNSQHLMLAHLDFNKSSFDIYKQEIFPTCMLSDCVHVSLSLNWLCVGVISNNKCYISTRKTQFHKKNLGILTKFLLASLVNI